MALQSLVQLGLTEKEALIYWTLIRNGASHVSSLAERASIKRVTVYSILESLTQRGLVDHEDSEHGRRYRAQDPENLLYSIEQEKAAVQNRIEIAKSCIQELQKPYERMHVNVRRFLYIQEESRLVQLLIEELSPSKKLHILEAPSLYPAKQFVHQWLLRQAPRFSRCVHATGVCSSTENAVLLIQEDFLFFIKQSALTEHKVEGMFIRDASYIRFVKEAILKPFLESPSPPKSIQQALL